STHGMFAKFKRILCQLPKRPLRSRQIEYAILDDEDGCKYAHCPGVAMGSHSRVHEADANTESVMRLVEISAGYWLSRALHVVADLGVADSLDEETRSAEYLA